MLCYRFLVRNTGFAAIKSTESNITHDKGHLLPSSTKASSDDSGDNNNLSSISGPNIGSRHLPPIYIDIQEEIEHNLDDINNKMKML